jgi:hypothetical protein
MFDEGVVRFEHGDFAEAARAFLRADELAPNLEALKNAIAAALKAREHLSIARAADRILRRADLDPALANAARDALANALPHVATIDVACAPEPCTIALDGEAVPAGTVYTTPGEHTFTAERPDGARAAAQLSSSAGASYQVELQLTPSAPLLPATPVASPSTGAHDRRDKRADGEDASRKPLPPWVFVTGCVGTAALAGLVTWSGVQTLDARNVYDTDPANYDDDKVRKLARRTDYLLAGALLLGAVTGAAGLWLVDWQSDSDEPTLNVEVGRGVQLSARGRF